MTGEPKTGAMIGSPDDFDEFIAPFERAGFVSRLAKTMGGEIDAVRTRIDVYLNEMRFGYRFLANRLPPGHLRILEVGAGLGLLSIYLHKQGHEVVALEPAAPAFGIFETTRREIWSFIGDGCPKLLEQGAEELTPETEGTFDFIFSINVMEHIAELERAFAAIASVLKSDGVWINSCPNYIFPYEPHYALPLVPFAPNLSRKLHKARIGSDPDTWDTLNFIDWLKVRRMARQNRLNADFETATLYESLARIGKDEGFAARHEDGLAAWVFALMSKLKILNATRLIPPALASPMIFKLTNKV